MAKIKYSTLKLKTNKEEKSLQIGEKEILIKQYLEVDKKASLVNNAVKAATIDGYVDEIFLDVFLHMSIIELYTNIDFGSGNIENIFTNFDALHTNGVLGLIIQNMNQDEYDYLFNMTKVVKQNLNLYNRSYAAVSGQTNELKEFLAKVGNNEK